MDDFWALSDDALPVLPAAPMEVEQALRAAEEPAPAPTTAPPAEHAPQPAAAEPAQPEPAPAAATAAAGPPWQAAPAAAQPPQPATQPATQPAPAVKPQSGFGPSLPERGARPSLHGVKGLGLGSSLQRTSSSGTPSSSGAPGNAGRAQVVGLKALPSLLKRASGTGSALPALAAGPLAAQSRTAAPGAPAAAQQQQQHDGSPEHARLLAEGLTQKRLGLLTQASHSWARPPVPVADVLEGSVDTSGTEDADMSPGGLHAAGTSYLQASESPPGEHDGFAAPPDLAAVPPNTRLPVVCNGNRGLFLVHRQVVVCLCEACRARAAEVGHPEIELTPTDFERHSGHHTSKKWKYTIKVMENTSIGFVATMNMGTWLDKYCPSLAKGSGCRGKSLAYSTAHSDLPPAGEPRRGSGGGRGGGGGGGGGGGARKRVAGGKRKGKDGSDSPSPGGGGGGGANGGLPLPLQGIKDEPAAAAAANMASPASLASPSSKKWLNTADADIKVPDKPEIREGARFQAQVPPFQGPRPAGPESQHPRAGWPGPSTLEALAMAASYEKRASDALHIDAVADPEYHPGGVHDVRNLMVERGQRKRRKPQWLATSANPMEQPLRALNPSRPVLPPGALDRQRELDRADREQDSDGGAAAGGGPGGGGGPAAWKQPKPAAKRNKSAEPPGRDAPPKRPRTTLAPVREARVALPVLSAPPPPLVTAEGGLRVLDWQVIGDGFLRITVATPDGVYAGALMPQPGVQQRPPPPPALHALMAGLVPAAAGVFSGAPASAIPPHLRLAAQPAAAAVAGLQLPLLPPAPASAQLSGAEPTADAAAAVATGPSARSGVSAAPKGQAQAQAKEGAASKSASPEVAANSGVPAASSGAFQPEGLPGGPPAAPGEQSAQPSGDPTEVDSDRWEAAKQSTARPGRKPNHNRRALASREYDRLAAEGPPKDARCALCRQGADPAFGAACRTEEGGSHLDSSMTERREGGELGPLMLVRVSAIMNAWVHVQCALWSPEVYVNDDGSVERASEAVRRGRMIKCKHCGEKGATLGCHRRSCRASFHLPCARSQNCLLQGAGEEDYMVTCKEHKAGALGEEPLLLPPAGGEQKPAASGGGARGSRRSLERGGSGGGAAGGKEPAERRRSHLSTGQVPARPRA